MFIDVYRKRVDLWPYKGDFYGETNQVESFKMFFLNYTVRVLVVKLIYCREDTVMRADRE